MRHARSISAVADSSALPFLGHWSLPPKDSVSCPSPARPPLAPLCPSRSHITSPPSPPPRPLLLATCHSFPRSHSHLWLPSGIFGFHQLIFRIQIEISGCHQLSVFRIQSRCFVSSVRTRDGQRGRQLKSRTEAKWYCVASETETQSDCDFERLVLNR